MHPNHTHCPNDLAYYRLRWRLSQKRAAALLGYRDSTRLSRYENGHAIPPLEAALRLGILYRVPVDFLFPHLYNQLRQGIRAQEEAFRPAVQGVLF